MAERTQRGFWSGFLYVTLTGGQLAALLLQVLLQRVLTEQQLYDWGWRIPFAVGAVLAVVVWWIRRGIHETRSFTHASVPEHERGRAWALFAQYPKETLTVMALTAARRARLLHVHDVHAEAAGQQRGLQQAGGVAGDDAAARDVPVPAAAGRLAGRPGRSPPYAARPPMAALRSSACRC